VSFYKNFKKDIEFNGFTYDVKKYWTRKILSNDAFVHGVDEFAFRRFCGEGRLKVANWLYNICMTVNSIYDDLLMKSCKISPINIHA